VEKVSDKACSHFMPTKVLFGVGELSRIGEEAQGLGNRAFVVTGRSALKRLGVTRRVTDYLESSHIQVEVFSQIMTNPTTDVVNEGARRARASKCNLIVGMGGGSAIDAAKGIAVVVKHGGKIEDYLGVNRIPGPTLPVVAVPTTSGTGSEVTIFAVFTRGDEKASTISHFNCPKVSILDPLLLISQPPRLTACTGMDALAHAIEAYTSRKANVFSDVFAREAVRLVGQHLRRSVWVGDDLEARKGMALASNLAGVGINSAGVTAGHALGMSIGGFCDTDHGTAVGILLPRVMERTVYADLTRFAEISTLLGDDVRGMPVRSAALRSIQAVKDLMQDIGFPQTLSQIGVKEDLIVQIVDDGMNRGAFNNTLKIFSREEARQMFQDAM